MMPSDELMAKAISERDRRPWRYYQLYYEVLRDTLDRQVEEIDRLEYARAATDEALARLLTEHPPPHKAGCPARITTLNGDCACGLADTLRALRAGEGRP